MKLLKDPKTFTPLLLAAVATAMLGAAFAAKPLYGTFCRVTGFAGTTQRAETGASEVLDRTVTVRFDTNISPGVPIAFTPLQHKVTLKLGEQGMAWFNAENLDDEPVTFVTTFNVTPFKAGPYFRKIQCFCFTEQLLDPGESIDMPVAFFVDPKLEDAPHMGDVRTITLSYTLFRSLDDLADAARARAEGGQG